VPKPLAGILESKPWKAISHLSTAWTFTSVPLGVGVPLMLGIIHHHSLEWIFLWSGVGLVMGAVFGVSAHELWTRVRGGKPTITSTKAEVTPLLYKDDPGHFIRYAAPPKSTLALVLGVISVANRKRKIRSIGKIRALLTFRLGDWVRIFSPGTWVNQFFSSVDLEPGDTRELIIGLSTGLMGDWRAVINRRSDSGDSISIDRQEIPMYRQGTVTVDLISCDSGVVIASFELDWGGWSVEDYRLRFGNLRQLS
jgi:hypothetical protein